jgi:uncharacterized metal-binding protein YceD (DUF177 family)
MQGLSKLLSDNAPECVKEKEFESFFGRKMAVDASMQIYQSMVCARTLFQVMLGLFNVDGVHIGNNYFVLLAVVPSI